MSALIETIAIGDELLNGKVSDTNSTYVAEKFFDRGFALNRKHVVADVDSEIVAVIRDVASRARFCIVFGGLGPTSDDKTAEVVAKMIDSKIITHEPSKERMLEYYKMRKREPNAASFKQVLYPEKTKPLRNREGMAPGFHCKIGSCDFFFLPGVPREMRTMFDEETMPVIEGIWKSEDIAPSILSHSWKCLGVFESELQTAMNDEEKALGDRGWIGYRTHFPENHLALYVHGDKPGAKATFEEFKKRLSAKVSAWSYAENRATLENLILEKLKSTNRRLAVAESCTGGAVAARLTQIPGSSEHFWGGVVTYQRVAKEELLGVKLANDHAAVSAQCAKEMASNLKARSGVEVAAAITGYFGPTGGTEENPVGTIYICCTAGKNTQERRITLPPRSRAELQYGAGTHLLALILQTL